MTTSKYGDIIFGLSMIFDIHFYYGVLMYVV
jgi:hypothetical protein